MNYYETLVLATQLKIKENPYLSNEELDGFVKFIGVAVPSIRKQIIKDAKKRTK